MVVTVGALHQLDLTTLRNAAIAWHDEFAPLPKPLIVGNFGGPTSCCKYGIDLSKQLTTYLRGVLDSRGSVKISLSWRTPYKMLESWSYPPLRAASRVHEALCDRGWKLRP
ncbi:hypothetical protein QVD17_12121 [Tagetes erecta]|uniref:Uncharacterized protein n=1 Tax=Tagetes erecta TaxID=13708 RepID=A0AAD8L1W9_TARER|nr:hypothetical protein QVD17_12121 [Tagetes erecta]